MGASPPVPPSLLATVLGVISRLFGHLHWPSWAAVPLYYSEIVSRIAVTLAMVAVIRAGHFVPFPGVELAHLPVKGLATEGERLVAALYGQARDIPASIFDLGISPYIHAAITLQIVMLLPPYLYDALWLQRLRDARKEGKAGEALINTYINWMAVALALGQALMRALELQPYALFTSGFIPQAVLALVAGSCIIQFCANTITQSGLGNGSSIVICTSVVHEYAESLHQLLNVLLLGVLPLGKLAAALAVYVGLVALAVALATTELRLPVVQYSSTVAIPQGQQQQQSGGGAGSSSGLGDMFASARALAQQKVAQRQTREYFPLQLNASGMMPVVIAGAVYFGLVPQLVELLGFDMLAASIRQAQASMSGLVVYGLLVFLLEFLPLGGINPKEIAEYFNTMNVGLRGVVPGEPTEAELRTQLLRCKFWGGSALALLAVWAQAFDTACLQALGTTLASTSLLIIVGTVLQAARQVEALLEGPKLQQQLDQERRLIQSLTSL